MASVHVANFCGGEDSLKNTKACWRDVGHTSSEFVEESSLSAIRISQTVLPRRRSRISALFSRVIAFRLVTSVSAGRAEAGLSCPLFSAPRDFADLVPVS